VGLLVSADAPADSLQERLVAQGPGGPQGTTGHVRIVATRPVGGKAKTL